MSTIWVVEMCIEGRCGPTVGVAFNRADGRAELKRWRKDNPSDLFRLVAYTRKGKQ